MDGNKICPDHFNINDHGTHCSCQILSMAANGRADSVDYSFCRKVLQRRWRMTCDHGGTIIKYISPSTYEPVILPDGTIEVVSRGASADEENSEFPVPNKMR